MATKTKTTSTARKGKAETTKPKQARSARGAQAREKLKTAAMTVLEKVGYHQMRVTDVTKEAGVAAGLFYHYFDDLKSLTLEVLTDFLKRFEAIEEIESGVDKEDWFGLYLSHFEIFVDNYAKHPGLMRCLLQLSDEMPEFHEMHRQSTLHQMHWQSRVLPKIFPESGLSQEESLLMVSALGGMSESLLREYYISRDPALRECELSNAEMAEFLAVMFYRGMFLANPPAEKLRFADKLSKVNIAKMAHRLPQDAVV